MSGNTGGSGTATVPWTKCPSRMAFRSRLGSTRSTVVRHRHTRISPRMGRGEHRDRALVRRSNPTLRSVIGTGVCRALRRRAARPHVRGIAGTHLPDHLTHQTSRPRAIPTLVVDGVVCGRSTAVQPPRRRRDAIVSSTFCGFRVWRRPHNGSEDQLDDNPPGADGGPMRARRVQHWSLGGPVWQGEVEGTVAVVPDRTRWHSVDGARI